MRTLVAVIIALVFVPFWSAASIALQVGNDSGLSANSTQSSVEADILITGGPIYTADDNNPQATAVAIKNGRFIYVGSTDGAQAFIGENTRTITLNGAAMFPGFVDAHAHLAGIGQRELSFNLENTTSLDALKKSITVWRNNHPEDTIIVGRGWIETHWPEKRTPTRWDLDQIITDIPVMLIRADGHAMVINSKAMELTGIDTNTDAPFGGDILRNALGENTGVLIDTAQGLVRALFPVPTTEDITNYLVKGAEVYAQYGWTGMHNMSVPWQHVDLLEELSNDGTLPIRVYNSVVPEAAEHLFSGGMRENPNGHIITRAIKLYMDGALGSRGAALLAPYSDAPSSGLLLSRKEDTLPLLTRALEDGFQVNMHAIGDRANRNLLDWYEEAMTIVPPLDRAVEEPRWRDEHTQIVSLDDILRYKELGIIPSMQPSHAIGDLHFAPDRLGDDRLNGAYAWSTLIGSGTIVAGGSDAPVERGDPLIEFYAATARRDLKGFQGPNWHADEALTRSEALKMFTLWPAIASFQEDEIGSITVGKQADLTVFNIDLMTVPEAAIPNGKALMTIVAGEIIYSAAE
ncbi:MAG: amidohydrolase [Kordiimonadales bacterium]|nr:MAG: amidohydrolase [Kordiimonadales bacterium]